MRIVAREYFKIGGRWNHFKIGSFEQCQGARHVQGRRDQQDAMDAQRAQERQGIIAVFLRGATAGFQDDGGMRNAKRLEQFRRDGGFGLIDPAPGQIATAYKNQRCFAGAEETGRVPDSIGGSRARLDRRQR